MNDMQLEVLLQELERWHVGKHSLSDLGESPIDDTPERKKAETMNIKPPKQMKCRKVINQRRWEGVGTALPCNISSY